ncbi:DUF3667 domain-containing protein [Dokdonia sinensis]|uniref:DUF3667 domain-containing protein n=1 Tax=Dokdonia sinensis TaxID=2479847 RepID=A0A3M0FU83_9FLAO|nr:DUF3667 domain-containing protein [Dokdonia sinensis]RMB56350.1 DUF3667 domain-containing protein [Dokdonia sinensis]
MKETPVKSNSRLAMQYRGVECLNCGHPLDLTDRFCSYCGQINTTKRLTLSDFFKEFVLSVFTYDSRFRHTLKDLLFKPGTITKNYVEGKRLHYANPFRFFLSASILYFILLGLLGLFDSDQTMNLDGSALEVRDDNGNEIDADEFVNDLTTDLGEIKNYNDPDEIEEKINKSIEQSMARIKEAKLDSTRLKNEKVYDYISEDSLKDLSWLNRNIQKIDLFTDFYKSTEIRSASKALDSLKYEKTKTNVWLYQKNNDLKRIEDNPARFLYYLASKTPFFIFFFSPIFALFFWLIYSKKRFNYMEHLVLIFHIFSWVFVVLLIALIPDYLFFEKNVVAAILLLLVGPFYFYKALRNFYKQGRFITIIKFVFLNWVFLIGTTLFALIFFAVTAVFF